MVLVIIQFLLLLAAYTVAPQLWEAPWWLLWAPALVIAGVWAFYLTTLGIVLLISALALVLGRR